MNTFQRQVGTWGLGLIVMAGSLFVITDTTHAQCTPSNTGDGTDNTITCNAPLTGISVDGQGGNDTIILNSTLSGGSGIDGGNDNDTITNNGTISGGSGIDGENGNDTITNNGAISGGSGIGGGDDNDIITNNGTISGGSGIGGDGGNDSITINGTVSGGSGIDGDGGNDSITINGTVSGGSVIRGRAGNDTITLLNGSSFDATSYVDGDFRNITSGNQDILILHSTTAIAIPDLAPCHALNTAAILASNCFLPWQGGVLYFVNFEQIQVVLLAILEEQGIDVSLPPVPTVICDDGRVKVFKLPNGDVEYYSGFDVRPVNGFLVGKVTLAELANSVRAFSDPNALGWSVVITQNGDALSGQVFDNFGNPVGNTYRH